MVSVRAHLCDGGASAREPDFGASEVENKERDCYNEGHDCHNKERQTGSKEWAFIEDPQCGQRNGDAQQILSCPAENTGGQSARRKERRERNRGDKDRQARKERQKKRQAGVESG